MRRLPLMPAAYTVSQPSASVPSRPRRDLQIVASLTPNAACVVRCLKLCCE